ncbi:hypothetical protein C0Z01_00250 [Photobacterium kishitanii]|uniref:hypothetical protein n=1 Tax=Photobacterium kishitanii TaxID=318456 RepID=UPI0007EFE4DA|nr:hypothetical protein [Photobacterium kishitanii]OBU28840.1 hypothetical protein AYY22_11800 [Photobacterium kishitanii]PSW71621.1 hypothetical protein C0Z01_00250 [Photobacterium kishitanii]
MLRLYINNYLFAFLFISTNIFAIDFIEQENIIITVIESDYSQQVKFSKDNIENGSFSFKLKGKPNSYIRIDALNNNNNNNSIFIKNIKYRDGFNTKGLVAIDSKGYSKKLRIDGTIIIPANMKSGESVTSLMLHAEYVK